MKKAPVTNSVEVAERVSFLAQYALSVQRMPTRTNSSTDLFVQMVEDLEAMNALK